MLSRGHICSCVNKGEIYFKLVWAEMGHYWFKELRPQKKLTSDIVGSRDKRHHLDTPPSWLLCICLAFSC